MKKWNLFIVYLVSFIYLEILFKILVKINIFKLSLINLIIFLVFFSLIMFVISTIFKDSKKNKFIYLIVMSLITIWFCVQYVVKGYFNFYISLSAVKIADQIGSFGITILFEILKRALGLILLFVPLILSFVFKKHINFERTEPKRNIGCIFLALLIYGLFLISLNINKNASNSPYILYHEVDNLPLNVENFGIIDTLFIDIKRSIFGFTEKITNDNSLNDTEEKDKEEIVYDYNILDYDFNALASSENNKDIKRIMEYMANDTGTLQNEYTGYFKDKNLILFMAESFNEIAVREDLTPTLYKLVNSGFSFKNFYTPTIYSTIGGEFQELTGLYATSTNELYKFRSGNLAFPQGIANKFKEIDYKTYAYHNNNYKFQDRNKYLKSLGFDNFVGCGNGLENLINCHEWPQSDTKMIETTIDDYINEDKFMVFYATVSGHSGSPSYSWNNNAQSKKNRKEYEAFGLNYSEAPASYLAAQMELDKALELLINKLEEYGKLDNTVIALVGDHNPYVLSIDEINEISTFKREEVVTRNKSSFILWNNSMPTVEVTKVGSQIDVMPTIYNVFGIDYDSRLFIGKDILSTEGGLAMFADRSWVTDKGTYYTKTGKFIPNEGIEIDNDYVKNINSIVNSKITMSKLIINNNFYNTLKKK